MLKEIFDKTLRNLRSFFFPCQENGCRAKIFRGHFLLYYLVFLLILKLFFASFIAYFPRNTFFADITKTTLVQMTNQERLSLGLNPLKQNPVLDRAAYLKAKDMMEKEYFSHISPSGINPWYWFKLSGYKYRYAGENLAIGFLDSDEVHEAWTNSPSHRANIINNKYQEIGIAVLNGRFQGNNTTVVVQLFGTKQQKLAAKTPAETVNTPPVAESEEKRKEELSKLLDNEKVLGAASDDQSGFLLSFYSYLRDGYADTVQFMIYASLLLVILLLAANFALKCDLNHIDLLAKAGAFIILLLIFVLFDKGMILKIIPHDLFIF